MLKGYLIFILVLFADTAAASSAGPGGSGMQWETGLQMIVRSVTGPVAYAFAAGGVVALGIRLAGGRIWMISPSAFSTPLWDLV